MKCLITGVNGFAGSHLADYLLSQNHQVVGTTRIRNQKDNIEHLNIDIYTMEMHDPFGIDHVIKTVKPEAVFHLAAQSFVGWSWNNPSETLRTNVSGTLYLLEALRRHCPKCKIQIASSSQVYGSLPAEEMPMGKGSRFNPMNPYDTSKLAQDMLSLQYFNSYGMNIVRTRAFNISGPRRGESFAESSWAKQIAEIEVFDRQPQVLLHGNLDSYRDYIDVRDVVKGYAKACFEGTPGEVYVIGSGVATKMSEIILMLLGSSTRSLHIETKEDPTRMRPSDTPYMVADTGDLQFLYGPSYKRITLDKTLSDLIDYWRDKLNEKK